MPHDEVSGRVETCREILEFYFSDSALLKDRFLQQRISENEEGWVSINVLATFNKVIEPCL